MGLVSLSVKPTPLPALRLGLGKPHPDSLANPTRERQGGRGKGPLSCCVTSYPCCLGNSGQFQPPDPWVPPHMLPCALSHVPAVAGQCLPQRCLPEGLTGDWVTSNGCPRLGASDCEASSHPGFKGGSYTLSSHSRTEPSCGVAGCCPCWAVPVRT